MRLEGTDIRTLRVFDAVVRNGGFASAQAELNISQPTISNHITALEQRLGVRLCQRGRSGFRLTEKGEIVHRATQRLLRSHEDFSAEVGALKGHLVGTLKLGLVDSIVTDPNSRFQDAIRAFQGRSSDATFELFQETPQRLQQRILDGGLHLAVGSFPHKISGLQYTPLYQETHGLFCGRHHHLFDASDNAISEETIRREPVVGRGYWRDEFQGNFGFSNITATVYQIEPQLMMIMSGQYIGFLPTHLADPWVAKGELRQLCPQTIAYICGFDLILKKGYRRTHLVETFIGDLTNAYIT